MQHSNSMSARSEANEEGGHISTENDGDGSNVIDASIFEDECSDDDDDDDGGSIDIDDYYSSVLSVDLLHQLRRDDPSILSLDIRFGGNYANYCDANRIDWEMEHLIFAKNAHLKRVSIAGGWNDDNNNDTNHDVGEQVWENRYSFYRAIARNRSIKHLAIDGCAIQLSDMIMILRPFFKKNGNLLSFEANDFGMDLRSSRFMVSALSRGSCRSLRRFSLSCSRGMKDELAAELILALNGLPKLREVSLVGIAVRDSWWEDASYNAGIKWCNALSQLLQNPSSKLIDLELKHNDEFNDEGASMLGEVLAKNNTLKRLSFAGNEHIGSSGWVAFSKCLGNSSITKLDSINLSETSLDDEGVDALGSALTHNSTLKALDLSHNNSISEVGWKALFEHLRNTTSLEKLFLCHNSIDDECVAVLSDALEQQNTSLKELDLSHINSISTRGMLAFSSYLQNSNCSLEKLSMCQFGNGLGGTRAFFGSLAGNTSLKVLKLNEIFRSMPIEMSMSSISIMLQNPFSSLESMDLGYSGIGYIALGMLAVALNDNKKLKKLNLEGNRSVTTLGWTAFFEQWRNPSSALRELYLDHNNIDDAAALAMAGSMSLISALKSLGITGNRLITAEGHQALASILQNPHAVLEDITLDGNINDGVMISYSDALIKNTALKTLLICNLDRITEIGWAALANALCNKADLGSIYRSNHTLQKLCHREDLCPTGLIHYLTLNRTRNKHEVIRQKILEHLLGANNEGSIKELDDLALKLWPSIIEFIGRDATGRSVLYRLFQSIPSLFET